MPEETPTTVGKSGNMKPTVRVVLVIVGGLAYYGLAIFGLAGLAAVLLPSGAYGADGYRGPPS